MGILILAALALGACFLDEIDKAQEGAWGLAETEEKAPSRDADKTEKPRSATSGWQNATSLGSEESGVDIAKCQVGVSVQFMSRDDCLARGGKVL